MEYDILRPVGVALRDVDLADLGDEDRTALRALLASHGVAIIPGQDLDDASFTAFLSNLGEMTFTVGETPVPGHPKLNLVSNVGRTTPPRSSFHVDTSYVQNPPAYTALRAVTIPQQGGQTIFTNQYQAAVSLPDELREQVANRSMTHEVSGVEIGPGDESSALHPLLRPHPVTGEVALYLTARARCGAITGMDDGEAAPLIDRLIEHSTREDNLMRHTWRQGDVVIWDNACVLHKADHHGVVGDRVMHRGMVGAYAG